MKLQDRLLKIVVYFSFLWVGGIIIILDVWPHHPDTLGYKIFNQSDIQSLGEETISLILIMLSTLAFMVISHIQPYKPVIDDE